MSSSHEQTEVDYTKVPIPGMIFSVEMYIERGVHPSHFLTALFSNDLTGVYNRADAENVAVMPEWVKFIYNQAPNGCWGSREAIHGWCDAGGLQGIDEIKQETTDEQRT